jgi:hypothetical protein
LSGIGTVLRQRADDLFLLLYRRGFAASASTCSRNEGTDESVSPLCHAHHMCRICEGATWEEVLATDATAIAVDGYALIGVEGDDHQPWVYTTGLGDSVDHPELVVAGARIETSARIVRWLADSVIEGCHYDVGDSVRTPYGMVRMGAVASVQYELDTFAEWHRLREAQLLHSPELIALQVILGASFFCWEHESSQPVLSDPNARVGEPKPRPNREERRRRNRRSHE